MNDEKGERQEGRSLGTECIAKKDVQNFLCTMNWFFCFLLTSSLTEEFILLFNAHFGASLYKEVAGIFCLLDIIQACFLIRFSEGFFIHAAINALLVVFPVDAVAGMNELRFIQSNV